MEKRKYDDIFDGCEIKYCRYKGKTVYLFKQMTKEEYERLEFNARVVKRYSDWCYTYKSFWTRLCPKHYNEIYNKHKEYIMWCLL